MQPPTKYLWQQCSRVSRMPRGALAAANRHIRRMSAVANMDFRLTDRQRELQLRARRFAREVMIPASPALDNSGAWPRAVFDAAWKKGLLNLHVPEQYGGPGLGCLDSVLVAEEFGYADAGMLAACTINTVAEIPLLLAGTHEQRRRYIEPLMTEPRLAAYCVTEPGAGSDVAGLRTRAERHGDVWRINGAKMWITNASVADWYFLLARTGGMHDAPGTAFTAFIVPRVCEGVTVGRKERMLGQRCSDTRGITFTDVVVPHDNVVGAVGGGFKVAMATFDLTRPPVAAGAVGLARRALDEALSACSGTSVEQAASFALADVHTHIDAARLLTYKAAWLADNGHPNAPTAAAAKMFAGAIANRAALEAQHVIGRGGFSEDSVVAKLVRDAKIFEIYEGTREIQKLIIARDVLARR